MCLMVSDEESNAVFQCGIHFVAIVELQGEMFAGVASSLESSHVKSVFGVICVCESKVAR